MKTRSQPVDDRDQRLHIGDVAGPQFATLRPAFGVEDRANDHLFAVRAMILAVPVLSQVGSALALEVDRRRIEEDQFQVTEQVAASVEQGFLKSVFRRARRKGRGTLLLVLR